MRFAAHIRETDHDEQSVERHCVETADLAAKYAAAIRLSHTARLAGMLHDMGKLTAAFDAYVRQENNLRRGELDHSFAGAKYLQETVSGSEDAGFKQTAALIGRVILSHHGLHDWVQEDAEDTFQKRVGKDQYYQEIKAHFADTALHTDIPALLSASAAEYRSVRTEIKSVLCSDARMSPERKQEAFAFYLGFLERILQSVLIDADRVNTADFMSASQTEQTCDTKALWHEMQNRMQNKLSSFSDRTDPISTQRKSISDRCAAFAGNDVHICKLIVPTGGGKTLSSLRFAVEYANQHPVDRIFYIAPFMSILEQNSDVIREIAGESAFLEHHSNMLAEKSESDQDLQEYELRTEKWDSPVITTTMVQFLNALFAGQTGAVRRMHRLSRAVIIVDEVQSIPLKCVYLFNLAMNFLSQICGSTIVLCSATQPPFEELTEFPLLLDRQSSMTGEIQTDFDVFRRTKLHYMQKTGGYSYDEAAEFCRQCFLENGSLLVVVNTKASARELYQRLQNTEGASVFHLSTNMCPQHRRERIDAMNTMLAKHQPVICVTTQLIEAGVDISFACTVRSAAGLDHAAQAAGRCNRSGEYHRICPVYLLDLYEEKLGSLKEIKNEQDVSRQILDREDIAEPLGVPTLTLYYRMLYRQAAAANGKQNTLRYPLNNKTDCDLINLLAMNRNRISKKRNPHLQYCGQAFKTAGSLFEVIDSNTQNVIVPYNEEAEQIIAALECTQNPKDTLRLLRQAQKYAVAVYAGTEQKPHQESAIRMIPCGSQAQCSVLILERRFYHPDYGVTLEGGAHEILMY